MEMDGTVAVTGIGARPLSAEQLCRTYAADVCRFAALMSNRPQEAEDLAQEALLRAVRSLKTYDPTRGPVEPWLWRIVANTARDAAGLRRRVRDLVLRIAVLTPREIESVEDQALARLRDDELRTTLLKLPVRDRTLLALRFGLDLDLEHVGAAVGLTADGAGKAVRRALGRLRALLEESTA